MARPNIKYCFCQITLFPPPSPSKYPFELQSSSSASLWIFSLLVLSPRCIWNNRQSRRHRSQSIQVPCNSILFSDNLWVFNMPRQILLDTISYRYQGHRGLQPLDPCANGTWSWRVYVGLNASGGGPSTLCICRLKCLLIKYR